MNKKKLGMFVCMLLIVTAVPAVGYLKDRNYYSTLPRTLETIL